MIDLIKNSFRNLFRKRFQTVLTIVSIAIGICAVTIIGSIGRISQIEIENEINSFGMGSFTISIDNNLNPKYLIKEEDMQALLGVAGVKAALPVVVEYAQTSGCGLIGNTAVWGIGSGEGQFVPLKLLHGRLLSEKDIAFKRRVCVIDQNMANAYFKRENVVGKTIDIVFSYGRVQFEIVGVAESGGNIMQTALDGYVPSFLYAPYTTVQDLFGKSGFSRIAIEMQEGEEAEQISRTMIRYLAQSSGSAESIYKMQDISRQKKQLNSILNIVTILLSGIAGISIVVAALGISTVMMVTVTERTKEIGIKKAIGAKGRDILIEFLLEALFLAGVGILVGFISAMIIVFVGCFFTGLPFLVNLPLVLVAAFITMTMGLISGVYPAKVAAQMSPVKALSYE